MEFHYYLFILVELLIIYDLLFNKYYELCKYEKICLRNVQIEIIVKHNFIPNSNMEKKVKGNLGQKYVIRGEIGEIIKIGMDMYGHS